MNEVRPWGSFSTILTSQGCKVKTIDVEPGKRLSYQSHSFRDERWIVVEGTAGITVEGVRRMMMRGEMVAIERGQKHRLDNPGSVPLRIVEVQIGERLDEDDIVRYEDDYGRVDHSSTKKKKTAMEEGGR